MIWSFYMSISGQAIPSAFGPFTQAQTLNWVRVNLTIASHNGYYDNSNNTHNKMSNFRRKERFQDPVRNDDQRETLRRLIDLSGEITKSDAVSPDQILPTKQETKAVVLNFTEINYINSTGIALLIRVVRQARDQSIAVLRYAVSSHYQKIFQMVGLTNYLYLYPDETTALAAAGLIR